MAHRIARMPHLLTVYHWLVLVVSAYVIGKFHHITDKLIDGGLSWVWHKITAPVERRIARQIIQPLMEISSFIRSTLAAVAIIAIIVFFVHAWMTAPTRSVLPSRC